MGSVNHPKLYDPAMMATIKAAFHDVWSTVEADGSRGDPVRDEDCKAAIVRRLQRGVRRRPSGFTPIDRGVRRTAMDFCARPTHSRGRLCPTIIPCIRSCSVEACP